MQQALAALCLTVASVLLHVGGFFSIFVYLQHVRQGDPLSHGPIYIIRLVLGVTLLIVALHLIEVSFWAVWFQWVGAFPDASTALSFSLGSYSTVGTQDLVLPHQWRMLGSFEGLVGALLFGLSTAFIFSVINAVIHMWENHQHHQQSSRA